MPCPKPPEDVICEVAAAVVGYGVPTVPVEQAEYVANPERAALESFTRRRGWGVGAFIAGGRSCGALPMYANCLSCIVCFLL